MISYRSRYMYTSNTKKCRAHTHSSHFIYLFLHRLQIPLPAKQAVQARGTHHVPSPFPPLLPSRRAIVLLLQSKAKQSLPAQRSPSLSLNHLLTYPVPFAHLACIYLFSRDVKIPREPMTRHQLGILRQHSSRACVRSQPWAES